MVSPYKFDELTHRVYIQQTGFRQVVAIGSSKLCKTIQEAISIPNVVYARVERIGKIEVDDVEVLATGEKALSDSSLQDTRKGTGGAIAEETATT